MLLLTINLVISILNAYTNIIHPVNSSSIALKKIQTTSKKILEELSIVNINLSIRYNLPVAKTHCAYKGTLLSPLLGDRVTRDNIRINDIITCKVWKISIYSVVRSLTPTMINVSDLTYSLNNNWIEFRLKNEFNPTTKNTLGFTRKIFKVANIVYP